MKRSRARWAAVTAVALALVAACAGSSLGTSAAAARRSQAPNIVVVLTDDQRWDTLPEMPTVEQELVGHGVTFTNSFVVNSLCCPSRTSLLTGQYSHSTGVYKNMPPHGGFESFRDSPTIATVLHDAGYTTGLFGKYLNGYGMRKRDARYTPPGWDHWTPFLRKTAYYDYRLVEHGRVRHYGGAAAAYSTDVLARKATSFVAHASRPFFMEFTPFAPHEPSTPPPRYLQAFANLPGNKRPDFDEQDLSDKPAYVRRDGPLTPKEIDQVAQFRQKQLASTLAVDDAVRAIIEALRARHVLKTTMIVFASDNGVVWGEHSLAPMRKLVPYEESIRVPLVIRYDPLTGGQQREDPHLAVNIDLAPTFAALVGRKMPGAEGRSLVPLLAGRHPAWRHDFLIEHLAGRPQKDVPTYCAVRSTRYKYVLYQTREEELYDLKLDPYELDNRASDPALNPVKDRLHARLAVLCKPRPPGYTALSPAS